MKLIKLLTLLAIIIVSCKEQSQTKDSKESIIEAPTKTYPESIASVFEAHGGIAKWNAMNNLCFTMEKEGGNETHTVDLKSRKVRIESETYTLGFNGEKVWIEQDSTYFPPQRARFYHNLMFYFYAMPFVLGDDGISYTETAPLQFNDVSYPGTKISFGNDVGDAPDDEYILYRDPDTNKMAWLAYTVTYGKNEKSDQFNYIKYDQWADVNGIKLPSKLQFYQVEEGLPTAVAATRTFIKPSVTSTVLEDKIFQKPEKGEFAE